MLYVIYIAVRKYWIVNNNILLYELYEYYIIILYEYIIVWIILINPKPNR